METTGYRLREALKLWGLRKAAAEQAFPDSLFKFDGEEKTKPADIVSTLVSAEASIAQLQVAQMRYNLSVMVEVEGQGQMPLAHAIKLAGSAERIEKLWRGVKSPSSKRSRYDLGPELTRDPNQLRAASTITDKEALNQTSVASKRAGALRAAIASGNSTKVEIENLVPSLFE